MLRAQYDRHGPVPQEAIHALELEQPPLEAGQADPLQLAMMSINPPTAALLLSEFVALAPGK